MNGIRKVEEPISLRSLLTYTCLSVEGQLQTMLLMLFSRKYKRQINSTIPQICSFGRNSAFTVEWSVVETRNSMPQCFYVREDALCWQTAVTLTLTLKKLIILSVSTIPSSVPLLHFDIQRKMSQQATELPNNKSTLPLRLKIIWDFWRF